MCSPLRNVHLCSLESRLCIAPLTALYYSGRKRYTGWLRGGFMQSGTTTVGYVGN